MSRLQKSEQPQVKTLEEQIVGLAGLDAKGLRMFAERMVMENHQIRAALDEVRHCQEKIRQEHTSLCAPEHYPAVVMRTSANRSGLVEVYGAGGFLEVSVGPEVPPEGLRVGARGLLTKARNCLVHVNGVVPSWSEVGAFEGYLADRRRILIKHHEQLVAATMTDDLAEVELRKGDLIGFDHDNPRLAYEKVDPPGRDDLFCEETPVDRFEELGGLDPVIAQLKKLVRFRFQYPEIAKRYRLPTKTGVLLEGPPGNGKTKLARCLARYLAETSPDGKCRFMKVEGSTDYSMWLGQSEQQLKRRFDAARERAREGPVIIFFDEIDALGRRRGSDIGGAPDRILSTFLGLLDGMTQDSNMMVVAATNRADMLDPGLVRPGRFGNLKIRIPPPNREGARRIVERYLDVLPLDGERSALVEGLISRLFSPRGEYAELARVKFRDGRNITLGGKDLINGALLENVVAQAGQEGADREVETKAAGVTEAGLAAALDRELQTTAAILTPGNVRHYIARLPQDVDPVAVEVLHRNKGASHYVRAERA